ncbi:peptidoglycan-binding protein [Streptomyces sp. NPDC055025]
MTGQLCPECGTPRAADDRPGCACAERPGPVSPAGRHSARPGAAETAAETTMVLTKITAAAAPEPPAASGTAQPADTRKADGAPGTVAARTAAGQAVAARTVTGQAAAGQAVAPGGAAPGVTPGGVARASGQPTEAQQAAGQGAARETAGGSARETAQTPAVETPEKATEKATEKIAEDVAEEIAEAEDFNPLRVRPYVTLDAGDDRTEPPPAFRTTGPMPPLAPATNSATPPPARFYPPPPPPRRTPYRALAIGAAALAVIGTAAFAGGLFSGSEPGARTLPDQSDLPAVGVMEPDPSDSPATPTRSAASLSTGGAAPSSPGPTVSTAPSATATASATTEGKPSAPPSSPAPEDPPSPTREASEQPSLAPEGISLGPGDSGPEVAELQNRLGEVWLFRGPADGRYDQRVEGAVRIYQSYKSIEGDPEGVYGPNTRRALEAETTGHGRRH